MALFGMECGFSQSQLRARRHENGGLTPGAYPHGGICQVTVLRETNGLLPDGSWRVKQ